jgi:uncharacterized protein
VTGLRNGKSPRSAAVLPLGILFAMLGIAAAVVIWLSLTVEHVESDAAEQGPKAVGQLIADKKPEAIKKQGHAGAALTPPPTAGSGHTPAHSDASAAAKPPPHSDAHAPAKSSKTKHANAQTAATPPPAHSPRPPRVVVAPIKEIATENVPGQLQLPTIQNRKPLSAAPAAGLVQTSGLGPLPMIGVDGRQPWRTYARPFDRSNKKPRIAIVVTGLGLSSAATNIAIQSLPGGVTLAFAPYASRLHEWIRLARSAGHEVLLNIPMEPVNYPEYDPGPQTLLTSLPPEENVERLLWTLSRATGYVGVAEFMGSRFTTSRIHLRPILKMLKKRGLMFLDSKSASRSLAQVLADDIGIPFAANNRFIDEKASRHAIDRQLKTLESNAKKKNRAIGIGSPYPVTLERIANWVKGLNERGFVLAPISAMVNSK